MDDSLEVVSTETSSGTPAKRRFGDGGFEEVERCYPRTVYSSKAELPTQMPPAGPRKPPWYVIFRV